MAIKKIQPQQVVVDEDFIIKQYMQTVLERNHVPGNVFQFCRDNKIEESEFYMFFSSFEAVRKEIWTKFFDNALLTIAKEPDYFSYSNKDKLLTIYFTLFEIFNLNRTYIVFSMKENGRGMKNLNDLSLLRKRMKDYAVHNLKPEMMNKEMMSKMKSASKFSDSAFGESVWVQFLFILKFWMDDTSRGFEKTDIMIEKSVNTADAIFNTAPLEKLFDLGKFLFKERKMA